MPPSPPTPCPVREDAPGLALNSINSHLMNDPPAVAVGDQAHLDMRFRNSPSPFTLQSPIQRPTLHQKLRITSQEARAQPSHERHSANLKDVRIQAVKALVVTRLILLSIVTAMPLFIMSDLQYQSFAVACVIVMLSSWSLDSSVSVIVHSLEG